MATCKKCGGQLPSPETCVCLPKKEADGKEK